MARKKDTSEEDWFEDDDEDVKPKKKSKRGRKKKSKAGKVIAWIVAFIVILAILLFIRFKYAAPVQDDTTLEGDELPDEEIEQVVVTEPEDEYEESGVYEEPRYAGPDVVEKDELPKVAEVIDTTAEPVLFSNMQCNYDYETELLYMSLRIYNILDEEIKISPRGVQKGYNTYFMIRGIVDTDPGCDTELLKPGEWTECDRIGFDLARYANVEGINRISVQVPGKTEALLIECPEMPSDSEEDEE